MASTEGYSLALPFTALAHPEVDLSVIVQTYAALLYRVAYAILRNPSEAEDVVQDTFVRVLRHQHTLGSIRDLRVWLVRIAWNLSLDRRRRIRPQQLDPAFARTLVAATLPADQALQQSQRMQSVLEELEKLPHAERHILLLSAVDELSTPAIAAVLGRSESATRALLSRARTRLRERLAAGKEQR